MSVASTSTLSGWRWRQNAKANEDWHQCAHDKPTTEISTDLIDAKIIPNPFIDDNERHVQWVGEANWEYACDFQYEPDPGHTRQDLVLAGLDTMATVYLNDRDEILESTNMFHRHRIGVTGKLRPGLNTVRIVFMSALYYGRELEKKHGSYRAFSGANPQAHVRKAQYHYGWDWGPLLMTCGPCGEIKLKSCSSTFIDVFADARVSKDLDSASVKVAFEAVLDQDVTTEVTVIAPNGHVLHSKTDLSLSSEESRGSVSLEIVEPQLWYPVGHDPQVFYLVDVAIMSHDQIPLHHVRKLVGIRRLHLVQQPLIGDPGSSFFFEVNNNPVYTSGSNWIPGHSFLTAMTARDYASAVDRCVKANQNMLRIWGGGIYEHDAVYEECD